MKKRILIIEDNYCKFFTIKQVIESQLRIDVQTLGVTSDIEIYEEAAKICPDTIIYRPDGGVTALLERMRKSKSNRRNTEIVLMAVQEYDVEISRQIDEFVANFGRRAPSSIPVRAAA